MAATSWLLTIKPTFLNELLALEPREAKQVQKKLLLLAEDPTPDAKVKKQLRHWDGRLHRLRAGDFRVFYTFEAPHVSVLALRRRQEDTYDEDLDGELLGGPAEAPGAGGETWARWLGGRRGQEGEAGAVRQLPKAITKELLRGLGIPAPFHEALCKAGTEDDLQNAPVPQDLLLRVMDAVFERSLAQVTTQPDLVVSAPDDLLRFQRGELLGFLLRLNPEQEKFVGWALKSGSATLLKGGPGTGKSTVALYRVKAMLEAALKEKKEPDRPRVLFTTYTRALTRASEQLLRSLLGDTSRLVDVRTADAVAREVVGATPSKVATFEELKNLLGRAIRGAKYQGNALKAAAQRQAIERLDRGYLLEEILEVIEGRQLATLEAYLEAPRPGRGLALGRAQREAVWRVREALVEELAAARRITWEQLRAQAATLVESGAVPPRYDAVVIDEAQDLQPGALRMLVGLCKTPGGLFLTADANQSIYSGSFRWSDVHEWLKFQGKTGILRANHRSTRELGEAAEAYLAQGDQGAALDPEPGTTRYVHSGALPAVRAVDEEAAEVKLLATFFRSAAEELRLGFGACAVLCPFNRSASRIAASLVDLGIAAQKADASELDLTQPGVKVMTLKSAKGLEFPIVALAGFLDGDYPVLPEGLGEEERGEILRRERRTVFVAMTRAMRALLVVVPRNTTSPLLQGFQPPRWNVGARKGEA